MRSNVYANVKKRIAPRRFHSRSLYSLSLCSVKSIGAFASREMLSRDRKLPRRLSQQPRDDHAGADGANRKSRDNKRMKEDGRDGFRQTHIWPSFPLSLSLSPSIVHLARSSVTRPGILGENVATRNGKKERRRKGRGMRLSTLRSLNAFFHERGTSDAHPLISYEWIFTSVYLV